MRCPICKTGRTHPGSTTVTLERAGSTIVFKAVPAQVCDTCGEAYVDEPTARALLRDAEKAAAAGIELEVHRYEAA